jgi:hypothetical protein
MLFRARLRGVGHKLAKEVISMAEDMVFVLLCDAWTAEEHMQSDVLMINQRWLDLATNSATNLKTPT